MRIEVVADEGDLFGRAEPGIVHQSADPLGPIAGRAAARHPNIAPLSQRFHEPPDRAASFTGVFIIDLGGLPQGHRFGRPSFGK